ncbi:ABC transporter substrate-binding protein [Allostella sp. ATCC 35155]|nr:ABC transporter substrate-binding protein [Stella sp. ATCC 35155]
MVRRGFRRGIAALAGLLAVGLTAAGPAVAQTLRIGVSVEHSSLDPHFHSTVPNAQIARHIFDPLVAQDAGQQLVPGLALSWEMVEPTRWIFRLRANVRFHDGRPFEAEDAVVSLRRAVAVEGSPGGYGTYLRAIASTRAIDATTLEIRTHGPAPTLPWDLTAVAMVQRTAIETRTDAFNTGMAAIGTGPFRVVSWRKGESLELARNSSWWGGAVPWERVTIRPIAREAARVAALLADDVDLIDAVPSTALTDLRRRPEIRLAERVTSRVLFLALDSVRETSPFVSDGTGKPLSANPLRDRRVRRAISLAVDRPGLVDRIMEGAAVPAAQLLPASYPGTSQRLQPDRHDPAAARRLLAEAGYPDGFSVVLHGPNGRYLNDDRITVAIAGMLQRIGIRAEVASLPGNIFKSRAAKREFSLFMDGWSTETGDAALALRGLLATPDRAAGWGGYNRSGYSNPDFDAALRAALQIADDAERSRALGRAMEIAMDDAGMLPLYFQQAIWASRQRVRYEARADEFTLAIAATPAAN